jgi:Cd2+/Zn2+-exporting ATPase
MIAAALAAFTTGDFAEGAILIFIFAVSGVLEGFATAQSEKALTDLLKIAPQNAIKLIGNKEVVVPIAELQIGDIVLVKVGQQVPADGEIHQGQASFNQASITGEFIPVSRKEGDFVYAGSLVVDATVQITVTKDPRESVVQKMIAFVKQAQEDKTKSEKTITIFEKVYVYVVIILALFVAFGTPLFGWLDAEEAFRRGVVVLVVASPCALVASITPAILSTLSHGAKKGILIKSGRHLEKTQGIDLVVLDKTGTLTTGVPKVVEFVHLQKCEEDFLISTIVNMERQSTHPLAQAIVDHFPNLKSEELSTKEIPGRGMQAETGGHIWHIGRFDYQSEKEMSEKLKGAYQRGETVVLVIRDQELVAYFSLKDTIRESSKQAIQQLRSMGIQTIMLTGDNAHTAEAIANEVGLDGFVGDCLPEGKVAYIQEQKQAGKKVLMIGDGINDAPSLVTATLGIAMGSGTDVSLETADIVMMNNNLMNIPYLMKLTRHMQSIIRQNVVFSISVILLLLVTNLFGLVVLRYGVIGHEVSTILVILNSLRMLSPRIR